MDIENSVIVITGAGQGLGQMMAVTLAQMGARLALIDVNTIGLRQTQDQCHMLNSMARIYEADVTDEEQVDQAFMHIMEDFEYIDILINNAGILDDGLLIQKSEMGIKKMSLDQFQTVMNVNVTGTFLCGREAAKWMVENETKGVIINISSAARAGNIGQTNYAASKAAVTTMAVGWARELGQYGIRVAAIAPGLIDTPMAAQINDEAIEKMLAMVPLARIGEASEIAHSVRFIIENDYFTGRVLEIDGGLRL
ncbi:3-ketoacyl-ACP reductase [Photobacterium iliopiscarium]|uniref:KR domain-containing protein n=1 Tax=Photobacterium iliopiscarium TaxID=56192 RepID=A0A0D8PZS1_9GAMM|nr:SDR family oxidoreductase [Photobacterium iliopiscarium]KJG13557.1 3-ketoacyl-ACP reductase [Photobacterium iliopiscarium]KJG22669.1 3-ketoacyl-ACP reductase [Photobacterium iliopiscarium]PST96112.1 KR domain-containing protein [Photobacterium iliopiscarium]PST99571.1 KR domain-containing protein [Photobacterium iliopiscarium]PSV82895.1 KR domain-containing protein [Photobacterium iliopiscarium]